MDLIKKESKERKDKTKGYSAMPIATCPNTTSRRRYSLIGVAYEKRKKKRDQTTTTIRPGRSRSAGRSVGLKIRRSWAES